MSTVRVMNGISDLEGKEVNRLRIGRMVGRYPQPRYETTCSVCGAKRVFAHAQLTKGVARCVADGCGRAKVGEHLRETARSFRAQLEAEEDARRLETEAREREADEQAKAEAMAARRKRLEAFTANEIVHGRDEALYVSPELRSASMTAADAVAFNKTQSDLFVQQTPEYGEYRSNATADAMLEYLKRNGVFIFDVATLKAAFLRLKSLGLLQPRPAAPPEEPEARPKPSVVNLTIAKPDDGSETGWDHNGNPLTLNRKQVAALSADQYRRFKRIYADQLNSLPRTGPGPRGLNA